jgi:hypothetical protein
MRAVYEIFAPLLGVSFPATVVYSAFLYKLTFDVFSVNIAQGITTGLLIVLPIAIMLRLSGFIVTGRQRASSHDAPLTSPRKRSGLTA